ncbi:MAG: hypothetical protein J6U98_00250 [Abditibacteriota bacterium]|nr:hypothetical protein [Abditibacteriota bacterium]MBP5092970.1 hypothetical protein [Abditibacteriota bacterium]
MKKLLYLLLILMTFAGAAFCADEEEESIVNLPAYPGGEIETSMDITSDKIPVLVKLMLSQSSERASKVSEKDIEDALKGIERMRVLTVGSMDASPADVNKYYSENLPEGKWTKLFGTTAAKGSFGIYTGPDADAMYFYVVLPDPEKPEIARKAAALRLDGKPDYIKLAALFIKTAL